MPGTAWRIPVRRPTGGRTGEVPFGLAERPARPHPDRGVDGRVQQLDGVVGGVLGVLQREHSGERLGSVITSAVPSTTTGSTAFSVVTTQRGPAARLRVFRDRRLLENQNAPSSHT